MSYDRSDRPFREIKNLVVPDAGSRIDQVARHVIILALTEARVTEFEFNGTPVVVDPADVISSITQQWESKRKEAQK